MERNSSNFSYPLALQPMNACQAHFICNRVLTPRYVKRLWGVVRSAREKEVQWQAMSLTAANATNCDTWL